MIKYRVGDKVKVVDDNTHGVVVKVLENEIVIESDHGFDETYAFNEILPDVGMEEEIMEIKEKKPVLRPKKKKLKSVKSIPKLTQIDEEVQKEQDAEEVNQAELKRLIDDNFAKNSEVYREKLEQRYKKEIKKSTKRKGTFVLDLHYGQLENYSAQLPIQHILKRQLNAAINGIEKARNENYAKVILIHGKGKGVLETEIKKYLDVQRYNHYDADFRQYKLGATEVELK